MLKTEDIERMIVESAGDDARFAYAVDVLLGYLLSCVPEYGNGATDGVILVEPIDVMLVLDRTRKAISSGMVNFGDAEKARPIKYGSREHKKLRDEIVVRGSARYSWKERFQRNLDGWHRRPPERS